MPFEIKFQALVQLFQLQPLFFFLSCFNAFNKAIPGREAPWYINEFIGASHMKLPDGFNTKRDTWADRGSPVDG